MNDCLWACISNVCDCEHCNGCKQYLSVNSEKGQEIASKYDKDVAEALKPVQDKWRKDKERGLYGGDR